MRTILFQNNAASTGQGYWIVDRDTVIKGAYTTTGGVVFTTDPQLTNALFTTPTELILTGKEVLAFVAAQNPSLTLNIPVMKDSKIFVNFGAVKFSAVLFVEDVVQLSIAGAS